MKKVTLDVRQASTIMKFLEHAEGSSIVGDYEIERLRRFLSDNMMSYSVVSVENIPGDGPECQTINWSGGKSK